MGKESAFKFKENAESPEAIPTEKILGDLKSDESKIFAFQDLLSRIITNDISDREFLARLDRKTKTSDGKEYLFLDGNYVSRRGNTISAEDIKEVKDPEQKKLLQEVFKERLVSQKEREQAQDAGFAFQDLLSRIVTNDISDREFLARLDRKTKTSDGKEYLFLDGNYVSRRGNTISAEDIKEVKDPEQKKLLQEVFKLTQDTTIPTEVRENVKSFAKDSNPQSLQRMRALMEVTPGLKDRIEKFITTFEAKKRELDLKNNFYKVLIDSDSYTAALAVLEVYEERSSEDRILIETLRARALTRRREKLISAFSSSLAETKPNFDEAIALLDPLLKSRLSEDVEAGKVCLAQVYRLELAQYKELVIKEIKTDADQIAVRRALGSLPIRPSLEGLDYVQTQQDLKEKIIPQLAQIIAVQRINTATTIRQDFEKLSPEQILVKIEALPNETVEDIAVKRELVDLYRSYTAARRPADFDERFGRQIEEKIRKDLERRFVRTERGINREGLAYLRERFLQVIFPLIESFRDDPRTKRIVNEYLTLEIEGDRIVNPRLLYIQRLREIEKQRPLTDTERIYLQSVELLSVFNPYLVAAAAADNGVTQEFLRHHFEIRSRETLQELKDGAYFPLIQIGCGPNGNTALGEIVRNNPELARQMLIIDAGQEPGGPFAIPQGPAWELNSANIRGEGGPILPDAPKSNELKTVRAYGSPLRWYPGERSERSEDVRQSSINVTVDYLPTPDNLSTARYPTNEDFEAILNLQAALLINRIALGVRVVKVEPNSNPEMRGDKIVTVRIEDNGKSREVKLYTDADFNGTGLGEPTFGFELNGSRAEKVLAAGAKSKKFPKLSTTLEAFQELGGRSKEKRSPGRVLIIYGGGNSADTLIEFIGNLFKGDNPRVRDVVKLYVITENDLSSRPRYAAINDLKPRNGRGNLLEQIRTRVTDIDFENKEGSPASRKLVAYGPDDRLIADNDGKPIIADAVIAAVGFRPQLDSIYAAYLEKDQTFREGGKSSPVKPLTLPTNSDVSVADVLKDDSNILFFGTASSPRFDQEKRAQLPKEARDALSRNGAENAVAVGFRAPDTQAAVNIWLNQREIVLTPEVIKKREKINFSGKITPNTIISFPAREFPDGLGIPNNIADESLVLSPLLAYSVGNSVEVQIERGGSKLDYSGSAEFILSQNQDTKQFQLKLLGHENISQELFTQVRQACEDLFFQRYALSAFAKRRRDPKLQLVVVFKNGKMDPRNTVVQVA